eukprot:CAMPEP_0115862904 /NCGR_PEP_ID=MMETSP0287-20121206/18419_1 /TAXON_ID=412157 /ORGANISM="Chrysochromulina rotalis, Strain UIO044" /LENGTH=136 /DNA_ID=CAMNT_0003317345 /DNA_START=185 /DNA_END=591 /DNA_ORIENTATION=-
MRNSSSARSGSEISSGVATNPNGFAQPLAHRPTAAADPQPAARCATFSVGVDSAAIHSTAIGSAVAVVAVVAAVAAYPSLSPSHGSPSDVPSDGSLVWASGMTFVIESGMTLVIESGMTLVALARSPPPPPPPPAP